MQPTPQSIDYEVAPQSNLLQYVDHAGYKTELGSEVEVRTDTLAVTSRHVCGTTGNQHSYRKARPCSASERATEKSSVFQLRLACLGIMVLGVSYGIAVRHPLQPDGDRAPHPDVVHCFTTCPCISVVRGIHKPWIAANNEELGQELEVACYILVPGTRSQL